MTRKAVWFGLPYLLGLALCASGLPWAAAMLCVLPMLGLLRFLARCSLRQCLCCGVAFLFACGLYFSHDRLVNDQILRLDGQTMPVFGKVIAVRDCGGDRMQITLRTKLNGRRTKLLYYGSSVSCAYGDTVSMTALLRQPEDSYLFPAQSYQRGNGILLEATAAEGITVTQADGFSPIRSVQTYRSRIISVIRRQMPRESAQLLLAMLFGEKQGMEDSTKTALYRTGIGHVTAVSGLHLTLLCGLVQALLRRLRVRREVCFLVVVLLTALFAICADASMSVLRAGCMLLLVSGAGLFRRQADTLNSLCIACILLTVTQPDTIRNASFLLSASGVFAMGVLAPFLTKHMPEGTILQRIRKQLCAFACVTAALVPVSALFFEEASLLSPIANLILLPVCLFALLCGLLVAVTSGWAVLAAPVLLLADLACRFVLTCAGFCAALPGANIPFRTPLLTGLLLGLSLFVLLIYGRTRKRRQTTWAFVTAILLFGNVAAWCTWNAGQTTKLVVLGKGDSCTVLAIQNGCADIWDLSGGSSGADYVGAYLRRAGISKVRTLVLTKQPDSAMRAYTEALRWERVETVILPETTYVPAHCLVCGCVPVKAQTAPLSVTDPAMTLHRDADGLLRVCRQGQTVVFGTDAAASPPCDLFVQYDGGEPVSGEAAQTLVLGDDTTGNQLELLFTQDAEITITLLERRESLWQACRRRIF